MIYSQEYANIHAQSTTNKGRRDFIKSNSQDICLSQWCSVSQGPQSLTGAMRSEEHVQYTRRHVLTTEMHDHLPDGFT